MALSSRIASDKTVKQQSVESNETVSILFKSDSADDRAKVLTKFLEYIDDFESEYEDNSRYSYSYGPGGLTSDWTVSVKDGNVVKRIEVPADKEYTVAVIITLDAKNDDDAWQTADNLLKEIRGLNYDIDEVNLY